MKFRDVARKSEESRKSFGHWCPCTALLESTTFKSIWARTELQCALFLSSELYATNSPSIAEQERDTAFVAFKSLAREQHEWMGGQG